MASSAQDGNLVADPAAHRVVTLERPDGQHIIVYVDGSQAPAVKPSGYTRFVCMSDTHNAINASYPVPDGDIFIHAGDLTSCGTSRQVKQATEWLVSLSHPKKLVIAGNHDLAFDLETYDQRWRGKLREPDDPVAVKRQLTEAGAGIVYLEETLANLDASEGGWHVFGSPWQPAFGGWAFNGERGAFMKDRWRRIPEQTDILITHGPPRGILDRVFIGESCGCDDLLARIKQVRPLVHVFGHIHEGHGVLTDEHTVFINASTLNHKYRPAHPAIVFDLGRKTET
ncbi:Metallo-dependent phosphatase-like protein [Thamnocephalis sphaerospora]|uniref:Metallo-dependent phosphatase-like protein n=1 Tax=Thamnocephalis sphaerospora TaxID=78915 RepID=A0A4P9XZ29_9FUNG|nr:Metallo-dependent phosphatase-like protein [Thamnocephalis sphaerospora]|eukprot:RKP10981.1 Metallo-dependent phosphatase-like protein [Thamnocephalis sphaerospora]